MVRILAACTLIVVLLIFLAVVRPSPVHGACTPEPASQWAPAGYICPPTYGVGWASTYPGHGIARNSCVYPWTACPPLRITSLDTGLSVIRTPVTWCHCWVGVTGPNGETERIVDLDPQTVTALGLDPARGLWRVEVSPATSSTGLRMLPNTAMTTL